MYGCTYMQIEGRTPEIDTSEIIVDFRWHFPIDVHWHVPTFVCLSVVCSKGLSLSQRIVTGNIQWISRDVCLWNFACVRSGV